MPTTHVVSPREAARPFTPRLSQFIEETLFPEIWSDPTLSPRERSLITVAALVTAGQTNELPAHLQRAIQNGLSKPELSALILHLAFYAGIPAAVSASAIATATLGGLQD